MDENSEEYQAAYNALNTIRKTLDKHWMMKKPEDEEQAEVEAEPALSVEIEAEPAAEEEGAVMDADAVARDEMAKEPIRVMSYGDSYTPQERPSEPEPVVKRGRGRPRKVR